MSDGRASLWLEYYLGRSATPLNDDDGNPLLYTSLGAMKGKPKYKVSHNQKRDTLNLYVWIYPRAADEYNQDNNTLQLASSIRFEGEHFSDGKRFSSYPVIKIGRSLCRRIIEMRELVRC